ISGMARSISTTSGRSASERSIASSPLPAVPATSSHSSLRKWRMAALMNPSWSSTSRTRILRIGLLRGSDRAGQGGRGGGAAAFAGGGDGQLFTVLGHRPARDVHALAGQQGGDGIV